MNRNRVGYSLAPLVLLTLAACGDGGSDGGQTFQYAPVAIDESNAKSVTNEVMGSSQSLDAPAGVNALSSFTPRSAPVQKALTRVVESMYGAPKLSQTQQCSGGGSITVTESSEERVAFTANDCRYSMTEGSMQMTMRIDGKLTMVQQTASGFPPRQGFPVHQSWGSVSLSFSEMAQWQWSFDSFSIQLEGDETISVNYHGDMQIKAGTNDMNSPTYAAIGSNSLRINASSTATGINENINVSGLSLEGISHTNSGLAFTEMIYHTTYSSGSLAGAGGQVTVTTIENLMYDESTAAPMESGKLKITGSNNSSVMVTVPGRASDVQLDIDSNGDGVTDKVEDLSWAELQQGNTAG